MDVNLADIKDVAIIAKPFVDPIISTLIKPKIKSLETWLKQNRKTNKAIDNYFENKFTDYFISSYHKFININVLVFPNQQINIKDIYQPLTITSSKDHKSFQVGNKKLPFISKCKRVLISDSAGMGKSTLSKWIGLNLIESKSSIPVLIELRKLNSKNLIVDEIINQLDPIDGSFDEELLFKFVELGNFTFILDGFDEIDGEIKQTVIENVREFTSKALKNNFILTSRPESATSAFGDYQLFKINPLKANESKALIIKYDNVSNN